ncbi:MAG: hypothetical protein J6X43_11575, partial [Bacteroidales bacterium]|nr:hypothetical protein [Bacteroidales bacterium]
MTFFKAAVSDIRNSLLARNPCVCVTTAFIFGIIIHSLVPFATSILIWTLTLVVSAFVCIALSNVCKRLHIHFLLCYFSIAGYVCSALHQQQYALIPK